MYEFSIIEICAPKRYVSKTSKSNNLAPQNLEQVVEQVSGIDEQMLRVYDELNL